jgi:cellulose synthase/poly-beta-1,6-N-acetylglucosamine synthase-like glycosyltransferase
MIVINDGSEDSTDKVMSDFLAGGEYKKILQKYPDKKLRYYKQKNGGKGTALNNAITKATGEIIVTIDADSMVHAEAIEKLIPYFEDPKIDAAVGQVRIDNNPGLIGTIQKLEYAFGFYHKRAHSVLGAEYIFGGACAAFRKEKTFEEFGLFDTVNRTEDIEMSMRCRYFGKHAVYAEDVICYTEGPSDITGLVNQRLRWKKGRLDTFIKYRSMFFSRKNHHNRALAWFILPYCIASELQLFFEPIGFTLLATYSVLTGDYLSIAIGIMFVFLMYLVVGLFNHEKVNLKLMALFPFTWPLFYILVWVEYMVLLRSVVMLLRGEEIVWQRWNRKGVQL